MKWRIIYLVSFSVLCILFVSCEKKGESPDNCNPINFISLEAENDTIESGANTEITAKAEGDGLKYEWTKTLGAIDGAGPTVKYIATPCAIGEIEVTCRVVDECDNSISVSLIIVVI